MNGYHCYEGAFHHSLAAYGAISRSTPQRFTSSLDFLSEPALPERCIPPAGFIFHTGRCGSTLLAKALARSRAHLIFSEAGPHNQIWRALSGDRQTRIEMYRTLVLTMGRPRLSSYQAHIVKFTSFNIVNFPFIREAFPGVPALFLFRDPRRCWILTIAGVRSGWGSTLVSVEPGIPPKRPLSLSFTPPFPSATQTFGAWTMHVLGPRSCRPFTDSFVSIQGWKKCASWSRNSTGTQRAATAPADSSRRPAGPLRRFPPVFASSTAAWRRARG